MTYTQIVPVNKAAPALAGEIAAKARAYAEQAQSENTRRAYASDWQGFQSWCDLQAVTALPASPETVLAWLVDTAGRVKVTTQRRRLSAVKEMHRAAGFHLDVTTGPFQRVWKGIRNAHGQPPVKKAALMTAQLRRAVDCLPDSLQGVRDRALLLIGFAGALRRSELVSIEVAAKPGSDWIEESEQGLTIHLSRSKGDQEGKGQTVGIPYGSNPATCPVRAWRAWLQASQITDGAAFRSINRHGQLATDSLCDHSVARIIKRAVIAGELRSGATIVEATETAGKFAGHSLRRGIATSAAVNDVPGRLIQDKLRHKKFDTTAEYIAMAELHSKNAAGMVGL